MRCTIWGLHCLIPLVKARKQLAPKFSGGKSSLTGHREVQALVLGLDHPGGDGHHTCCVIYKQVRGYEIRLSLCPALETSSLVLPQVSFS